MQQAPSPKIPFGGIYTKGDALSRPHSSAAYCRNLRLIPRQGGAYLRLRAGKTAHFTEANAAIIQFYPFRPTRSYSSYKTVVQRYSDSGGFAFRWSLMEPAGHPYSFTNLLTISTSYGYSSGRAAVTTIRDRLMLYNGLGVRDNANSRPPFSSYDGTTLRYVGLDAYCPSGTFPTVASGSTGNNTLLYGCRIYVGLHNTATQHFSNAIYCGEIGAITDEVITVSNLNRLVAAYNNATEQGELKFVFYATIDGGQVPYLILNSTLDGPLTAAISATSQSLSVTSITQQGFVLDNTQERPIENFPPRPMSQIAYVNGRVYGILSGYGSDQSSGYLPDAPTPGEADSPAYYRDFTYPLTRSKDVGGIVWSAAAGDSQDRDFVGIPEESWPTRNFKFAPNGELPVVIDAAPGDQNLLVLTTNGTYLLQEAADGLHTYTTISDTDGCINRETYVRTPRGPMWVTQDQQLVLLNASTLQLEVLSDDFAERLSDPDVLPTQYSAACYLRDPIDRLDQYKVWRGETAGNYCLIYDFALGGLMYEEDGFATIAALTAIDTFGHKHHIQTDGETIWAAERDPNTNRIAVRDTVTYGGATTDPVGVYYTQWMAGSQRDQRLDFSVLYLTGDIGAVQVTYYLDYKSDAYPLALDKTPQSDSDMLYSGGLREGNLAALKLKIELTGHSADLSSPYYPENEDDGADLTIEPYGVIYDLACGLLGTMNRT